MALIQLPIGLASLQRDAARERPLPPVERWNPSHCVEADIRIARDGTWYHQGVAFTRKEIVRLFSTLLRKDADGYSLVTPVEKLRVRVDDVPFLAPLLDRQGAGRDQRLVFATNVGDEVTANAENPIRVAIDAVTDEPRPYVHVRRGLEARITRAIFYELAELAVTEGNSKVLGVWSCGTFFALGSVT